MNDQVKQTASELAVDLDADEIEQLCDLLSFVALGARVQAERQAAAFSGPAIADEAAVDTVVAKSKAATSNSATAKGAKGGSGSKANTDEPVDDPF